MSHSPEPWKARRTSRDSTVIEDGNGTLVAGTDSQENARRIIACVNACAEIPTEKLKNCHFGQRRFVAVREDALAEVRKLLSEAVLNETIIELLPEPKPLTY